MLKYIEWGERKKFNTRPTCASRGERWYELAEIKDPILSKRFIDEAFGYFLNPHKLFIGDTFFAIQPFSKDKILSIVGFLNSTLGSFFTEIYGRTLMGEGVLLIYGPEIIPMPIIDPELIYDGRTKILRNFLSNKVESVFEELGAYISDEVSLDKVKSDRRELDKIIMGDILGLTEAEQLEVYKAVVDLVKSRLDKAKSFGKRGKTKDGVDMQRVLEELATETDKD
ncbi:hypothetical protein HY772_03885 [Candidatus Woesearchaeota archaeon]|nr:hypothetical protein [Candidatus Woesearchaeota archaeon]